MAYNFFPTGYQPYQIQPQQMQMQQPQQQQNASSLIWVQGEGAAKSYLVAPNTTVALFDNESQTIYVKSADASGMPSMRILDYTFRDSAPQTKSIPSESDFATKSDVESIREEINALRAKFEATEKKEKK